jgi:hypothetical protein
MSLIERFNRMARENLSVQAQDTDEVGKAESVKAA